MLYTSVTQFQLPLLLYQSMVCKVQVRSQRSNVLTSYMFKDNDEMLKKYIVWKPRPKWNLKSNPQ